MLADVLLDSPAAQDELFRPVAMAFRADMIEDAITLANDVPFGRLTGREIAADF